MMIIRPITNGLITAYLLNFVVVGIERHLLAFMSTKSPMVRNLRRPLAILISLSLTFILIYGVVAIMIPELASSFALLRQKAPELSSTLTEYVRNFMETYQLSDFFWVELQRNLSSFTNQVIQFLSDSIPLLLSVSVNITNALFNIIIGLIIAVHLLLKKEVVIAQVIRLVTISTDRRRGMKFTEIGGMAANKFSNYIRVRFIESLIIFVMMALPMLLLQMPYVILISTVIAITNLVPIVGPIFSAFPCFFIIAVLDPQKAVIFLVLHIVVQQLEGNIIGPEISRNALGLPTLWVLVSIVIGGGFFGIPGLLVAPPTATVLYELACRYLNDHEKRRDGSDSYEA